MPSYNLTFKFRASTLKKLKQVRKEVLAGHGVKASCKANDVTFKTYQRWLKVKHMDSVHQVVQEQRIKSAFEEVEGLYGVSLGRAVAKIGIGYDTVIGMRAARGEVPWGVQRKLSREAACEAALASLLRGVRQEKACADAGVSVQHFRPWRAARGVVPSQGELRRLRDLSKA